MGQQVLCTSNSVKLPEVFDLTGGLKLGLHSSIKVPAAFPASKVLSYSDTNSDIFKTENPILLDDSQVRGFQTILQCCFSEQASNSQGAQTPHSSLCLTHLLNLCILSWPACSIPITGPLLPICAPAGSLAEHTQLLTRTAQTFLLLSPPTALLKPEALHQTHSLHISHAYSSPVVFKSYKKQPETKSVLH